MKKISLIGTFIMCAAVAHGKQDPYYLAIASADGLLLLKTGETAVVKMAASTQEDGGLLRHDFMINGTALSVTINNGIITKMVRDGNDIGIKPPELELSGKEEWVKLSRHYHEEALRLLSFTSFLGVNESAVAQEFFVIGKNLPERQFKVYCETSGRERLFGTIYNSRNFTFINESVNDGIGSGCHVAFDFETGFLTKISGRDRFSATFFNDFNINNGGLKTLALIDPEKHEVLFEKGWNKNGKLIHERDLKKDPYPEFDINNVKIIKDGRAI